MYFVEALSLHRQIIALLGYFFRFVWRKISIDAFSSVRRPWPPVRSLENFAYGPGPGRPRPRFYGLGLARKHP